MALHMSQVYIATSVILLFSATRIAYLAVSRKFKAQRLGCEEPPSLSSTTYLFGLDFIFKQFLNIKNKGRDASTQELHEEYGNTFQANAGGNRKIYSSELQNVQSVFSTDFKSWGVQPIRLFAFGPLIGKGIMGTDGRAWEHSRALLRPAFSRKEISDLPALEVHVQKLLAKIPRDGSTVDLRPLFARLALDAATEMLFGESLNMLGNPTPENEAWLRCMNYCQMTLGKRMLLPHWNFFTRDPKFWSSCKKVREFVEKRIDNVLQNPEKHNGEKGHYVLAYELAKETTDRNAICNELLNVFLPAHEATGVALTNIFFNVARHPHVWQNLRREVLALPPGQDITFESLKTMKYLQAVISESLRLHPSLGTQSRIALSDTTLPTGGGPSGTSPIHIRKGDIFAISFYTLHRRKDLYGEDSAEFKPERWENGWRPANWAYLPFSGGPRVCIGQQMAITQTAYTIVKIMQEFATCENRDPVWEFVEQYTLSTQSQNGAKVAFTPA